jgi:uncharacterized protein YkwD
MADPPHRKDILYAHYDRIGVGVAEGPPGWYTFVRILQQDKSNIK